MAVRSQLEYWTEPWLTRMPRTRISAAVAGEGPQGGMFNLNLREISNTRGLEDCGGRGARDQVNQIPLN